MGVAHKRLSEIGRAGDLPKRIDADGATVASTAGQGIQILHASGPSPERSMAVRINTRGSGNMA